MKTSPFFKLILPKRFFVVEESGVNVHFAVLVSFASIKAAAAFEDTLSLIAVSKSRSPCAAFVICTDLDVFIRGGEFNSKVFRPEV
jgi:hypothetical protein